MKHLSRILVALFSPLGAILGLSFIAYGILSPWLGFYWDDWPLMWMSHELGPESLQQLAAYHVRPLSGWWLWLGAMIAGEEPLGWHLIIWFLRAIAGWLFYYFGILLWPKAKEALIFAALIFTLFPGYRHQFVAVNTSYHIVALILFLLSLCLMLVSIKSEKRRRFFQISSIVLALGSMLTSEYIYGLELIRPIIIYLAISKQNGKARYKETLITWSPFLVQLIGIYIWRFSLSDNLNYPILIFDEIKSSGIISTFLTYAYQALGDIFDVTFMSWGKAMQWPSPQEFGERSFLLLVLAVLFSLIYLYFLFRHQKQETGENRNSQSRDFIILGSAGLLLAGIPFWIISLDLKTVFPADRLVLPMTFGAVFFLSGMLECLFKHKRTLLIFAYVLAISLAVGFHVQNAVYFYRDWNSFTSFYSQLRWRIPDIQENTSWLSPELPIRFSTDDSITAALNWGFDQPIDDGKMRLNLFYLDLRYIDQGKEIGASDLIINNYLFFRFEGSTENMLILDFNPPQCLRIYHPKYDYLNPQMPPDLRDVLSFSNLELIRNSNVSDAVLPKAYMENPVEKSWCYYFEKADLARQNENWEEVVKLGDIAFSMGDSPNHAAERLPFIEGYARIGYLDRAEELSIEALEINPNTRASICLIWDRIDQEGNFPAQSIRSNLGCN